MKKRAGKTLAIILSVAIAVTFMPITCSAASKGKKDIFDFVDRSSEQELKTAASEYPDALDLTDGHVSGIENTRDIITPVKFQNPFGTCWAFAATAAAEGSVIGEKTLNGEKIDVRDKKYDFSEKYLAWFTASQITDKNDSQYGEGIKWRKGTTSAGRYNEGGLPFYATQQYSSGVGPALEEEYPYRGKEGKIVTREVGGETVDFCYSADDDWTIDDSEIYHQEYQLEESYMLPTPAGVDNSGEYSFNRNGINAIKDQLMNNRPVQTGFCADTSRPNEQGEAKYINQNTWAHYTYEQSIPNHAVLIVGYDDNYPKENFISNHQPPADGAFLVKNSWGSGEEDFPNKGPGSWGLEANGTHTGYFWISYYDQTYMLVEALNFNTEGVDIYYVEEYDHMPVSEPMAETFSKPVSMANVYTAETSLKLSALSCQTSTPGTTVDYRVYILEDNPKGPEDGALVYEGKETYTYGGFHKMDIKDGPVVQKDQKYSVVVSQQDPNGDYVSYMNTSDGKAEADKYGYRCWASAVVNRGESYFEQDGEWKDLCDILKTMEDVKKGFRAVDNFPIKAYGDEIEQIYIKSKGDVQLGNIGETGEAGVLFSGPGATEKTGKIIWKSMNEEVVSVQAKDDGSYAEVTANDFGTAYIIATEKNYGSAVIKVSVKPEKPECTAKAKGRNIKVNWEKIPAAKGYEVKYCKSNGKWKTVKKGGNATSATIKNLKKGKYSVKVAAYACNKNGEKIMGNSGDAISVKIR